MAFTFADNALVDSTTASMFLYGVADATVDLDAAEIFKVEFFVNSASQQIQTYCSRNFVSSSYSEVWDGQGSNLLLPTEYPITAVASIKFSGNGDFASAQPLNTNSYFFDAQMISLYEDFLTPRGSGVVQVVYTAGYSTIPMDLQFACLRQFQYLWKMQGTDGNAMTGFKSVSKMNESAVKDDSIGKTGLIADVVGILDSYKRREAPLSIMFSRNS